MPKQKGCRFTDDIFKCIFLNENVWIPIKISLKLVPKGPINNVPVLFQIMAWCRPGDRPLFEPMMVSLSTHICITRPQWVKQNCWHFAGNIFKYILLMKKSISWLQNGKCEINRCPTRGSGRNESQWTLNSPPSASCAGWLLKIDMTYSGLFNKWSTDCFSKPLKS